LNDTQNKQGHCFIPYAREEHDMEKKRLHEWVAIQRRRFRIILKKMNQGQSVAAIDLERFDKLKKLGFIFNVHEYKFQCNLNELKEFHSRFGHSKVSPSHHGDRHLYNFVVRQRHLYRERILKGMNNSLCDERMEKLSKLDFVWRTSSRMN
jgi:DNA-binding SARP family transcriptional activator